MALTPGVHRKLLQACRRQRVEDVVEGERGVLIGKLQYALNYRTPLRSTARAIGAARSLASPSRVERRWRRLPGRLL